MGRFLKNHRSFEKAISTVIIGILLVVLVSVIIKQGHYNKEHFGAISLTLNESSSKQSIDKTGFALFVPANLKPMTPVEFYDTKNLYEKINGKAELYLGSDFQNLQCQRFASLADSNDWAEIYIYDMYNLKNSFAVYSAQVRSEAQFLDFSDFAYKTQDALFFVSGRYYIEIMNSTDSVYLMKLLNDFAVTFHNSIEANSEQIYELELFPKQYLKKHSFSFKTKNVFGFEGLQNTFTSRYEINGEELTAFISKQPDNDTAVSTAQNYCRFLVDNGAVDKSKRTNSVSGIFDFYGSIEIVFTTGPYVAGIHGAEDVNLATQLAKMLKDELNESATK